MCVSVHSVLIIRKCQGLSVYELITLNQHIHFCVIKCLCVSVWMCALNLDLLPPWSWSTANHFTASQWTGLMHLTTPVGADAWQCRTASLPAVTISLPFSLPFLSFFLSVFLQTLFFNFPSVCLLLDFYKLSFLVDCLLLFAPVTQSASS